MVRNEAFLAFNSPPSSVDTWLASLDELSLLSPNYVVPSHGLMGDASLIAAAAGVSANDAGSRSRVEGSGTVRGRNRRP